MRVFPMTRSVNCESKTPDQTLQRCWYYNDRILIKLASTWQGIRAAERWKKKASTVT